jgi:hypothetical protein
MQEQKVQRIAAFLCEIFDAGSTLVQFNFDESDVLFEVENPEWYDQLAYQLRREYEEDPEKAHKWELFEQQARNLLDMFYDA